MMKNSPFSDQIGCRKTNFTTKLQEEMDKHVDWGRVFDLLAEKDYAVIDDFLPENECLTLRGLCRQLHEQEAFRRAGIGAESEFHLDKEVRSDKILWIDSQFQHPEVTAFLEKMDALRHRINRECFLSLSGQEFHFAHYPPGSFYKRHLDQFERRDNRLISAICYLNEPWLAEYGGALMVYPGQDEMEILPVGGRLVLMRSDRLEHEVTLSHRDRYSLTGWFTHHPPGLGFLS